MANENKNTNELVTDEDDPTAELEVYGSQHDDEDTGVKAESESDSHTCGLGDSSDAASPRAPTIPELQSDLKSRTKTIGRLQYDIQQLRAKWLGLEADISAREEIVSNLLRDTEKLNETIARKDKLLRKRRSTIKSLKAEIRDRDSEQRLLEEKAAAQQLASVNETKAQEDAERELQDARTELEAARSAIEAAESELSRREEDNATLERQLDEQQAAAAQQSSALEEAARKLEELQRELELAEHEEKNLNFEINLRDELESELEQKNAELEEQLALLRSSEAGHFTELQDATQELAQLKLELETSRHQSAAQIVQTQNSTSSVVRELQTQLEKTEKYADSLRFQLQDSREAMFEMSKRSDSLTKEVATLTERNVNQSHELGAARAANEELLTSLEEMKSDHQQEMRTLRFELTEAQDSVAQTGDLNSQLASDLTSTRSFKEELERMLLSNEEAAQERIAKLEQQINKLSSAAEDFEQKMDTKNTAINVLLAELAKKTEQIESIGEIEEVIQEIDNRMSERFDEPAQDDNEQKADTRVGGERDRITRVLVGSIGAQELRFPLFKNRLTIGRTADNDIQLKTSYISRRHAVITTEGDATRVIDWGSKNGVYVNAERVKERFLSNGDIVAVGNAKFRYEERPKREV